MHPLSTVIASGRHPFGSFKFSCDDTLCELNREFKDTDESSPGIYIWANCLHSVFL